MAPTPASYGAPALDRTDLSALPGLESRYEGKVRDVYAIGPRTLVMVATDRISAFDVVLPRAIPGKGAVLNLLAAYFLEQAREIVPVWYRGSPARQVSVGVRATPIPVEIVVRGYLVGHAARVYQAGGRLLCGVPLPEGLRVNDPLPGGPIITPTTKAQAGHDEDITREEILARGLVDKSLYGQIERTALALFAQGTRLAAARGLILADTKYEFGIDPASGSLILIDEIHTPDSSRYFYADGFDERQREGAPQRQLSKEFVREWLLAEGFSGKEGQTPPAMSNEWVGQIAARYEELYERMTGHPLPPADLPPGGPEANAHLVELISTYMAKHPV